MPNLQEALFHSAGGYRALLLFNRKNDSAALLKATADLMKTIEQPETCSESLHVLIAVNPELVKTKLDAAGTPPPTPITDGLNLSQGRVSDERKDLLIQIAAGNPTERTFALRLCHDLLESDATLVTELIAEEDIYKADPFGFYHDDSKITSTEVTNSSGITTAGLENCSWLLMQRYQLDLKSYYDQSIQDQFATVGGQLADTRRVAPALKATTQSHKTVVSSFASSMARRGFSFRKDGKEGLCFLASSKMTKTFTDALELMISQSDLTFNFSTIEDGGLYFIPSSADFLDDQSTALNIGESAKSANVIHQMLKDQPSEKSVPIVNYPVGKAFVDYMKMVVDKKAFTNNPPGFQELDAPLRLLLKNIHKYLTRDSIIDNTVPPQGHNPVDYQALEEAFEKVVEQANKINAVAKRYKTLA